MRHRIFPSLLSLSLALGLCVLPAAALETDDLKTLLQTYYVDQVPENVLDQDTVQAVLDLSLIHICRPPTSPPPAPS